MKKFAIVGFGSRGQCFAKYIADDINAKLIAIAEPIEHLRKKAQELYSVSHEMCFNNAEDFFKQGKICDAIFLCTQDKDHYSQAMTALALGYDICLEKPMAVTLENCINICDEAERLKRKVMLTHVLRYAPFFIKIKELINNGELGEVVTTNLTENIAYWHFALSYVRGAWRNIKESSPTIIAKCCHDLDLLVWLTNQKCISVSSYGGLSYYNEKNAPKGSCEYCVDCKKETRDKCLYDAFKIYPEKVKYAVVGGTGSITPENIVEVLSSKTHSFGKCVFHSDNDAVDHQVVNMLFDNGSTAHLTMTAFSNECYRFIKIHGTQGEVYGNLDEGKLYFTKYGTEQRVLDLNKEAEIALSGGHGGGDYYLYKDFCKYIKNEETSFSRTSIRVSVESHIIGFMAEESRKNGGKAISIKNY